MARNARRVPLPFVLLFCALLVGCSAQSPPAVDQVGAAAKENFRGTLPPGVTLPANVSPEQRALVVDVYVDRAGYERSVNATLACVRSKGVKADDPSLSSDGRFLQFGYTVVTPAGGDRVAAEADAQKKYAECYLQYQAVIDDLWIRDSMPSEEQRQHAENDISQCLRHDGYDVADGLSIQEIQGRVMQLGPDKLDGASKCLMLHQDVFVVPDDSHPNALSAAPK